MADGELSLEDRITATEDRNIELVQLITDRNAQIIDLQLKLEAAQADLKDAEETIALLKEPDTRTPQEKFVDLLAGTEPGAELWYELDTILADYEKVRDVQVTVVSSDEGIARLKALYPDATFHRQRDNGYGLCSKAKALEIIARDWTNLVPYVADFMDCDKFVIVFQAHLALHYGTMNNWIGTWSAPHAFFTILCTDGELKFEPQNDWTFKPVDNTDPAYKVTDVYP